MSLMKIDNSLTGITDMLFGETKESSKICSICKRNEFPIVRVVYVCSSFKTCFDCFYCKAILKSGKNKGKRCSNDKNCKRHGT